MADHVEHAPAVQASADGHPAKRARVEDDDGHPGVHSAVSNGSSVKWHPNEEEYRAVFQDLPLETMVAVLKRLARESELVFNAVKDISDKDPAKCKLFVRELAWTTDSKRLHEVFAPFGEILEAVVVTDKMTGKSKGFGFVMYKSAEGARNALKEPHKNIDGRTCVATLASLGANRGRPGDAKGFPGGPPMPYGGPPAVGGGRGGYGGLAGAAPPTVPPRYDAYGGGAAGAAPSGRSFYGAGSAAPPGVAPAAAGGYGAGRGGYGGAAGAGAGNAVSGYSSAPPTSGYGAPGSAASAAAAAAAAAYGGKAANFSAAAGFDYGGAPANNPGASYGAGYPSSGGAPYY